MPNEIELKLRIADNDVTLFKRHHVLHQGLIGKPITRRLVSIYYDTPDLQLLHQHISLRVRRMSGRWFQAVKGAGKSHAGLHERMEWEDCIAKGQPDFTKITDPSLARIFSQPDLQAALRPIFLTDTQRTEWQLVLEDGTEIEVALDVGHVECDSQKDRFSEVELELKCGNPAHLFAIALKLQEDIPLTIENISKAARGYRYLYPVKPDIDQAQSVKLAKGVTVEQAFQNIALECLRHLQANQAALPYEPLEATHQMHIAIRRLKVAFRLFSIRDAALLEEIDWLNGLLGQARNWDVLLETILPDALANCNFADVLRQRAVRKQAKSHQELISNLSSQRYQTLLLTLGWLIAQPKLPISLSMKKLLKHHLISAYKKLPWRSETLGHLDEAALHKTRIKLKRLRYMLEFFKLPDQQSTQQMTALQKNMGTLNDIHVGKALIESLALRMPVEKKQHLADVLDDWEQRRLLDAAAKLETRWKKLRRKKSQAIDALPGKIL